MFNFDFTETFSPKEPRKTNLKLKKFKKDS